MKRLIPLFLLFLLTFSAAAQQAYERRIFRSPQGDSLQYRLLRPEGERPGKRYPLVLFLHGAGERGSDNEKQLTHGGQMFLNPVNRERYPAFVLAPQCPETGYWAYPARPTSFLPAAMPFHEPVPPVFQILKELVDTYLTLPEVDTSRVYIIGLSMGGMATYDLVIRYPDVFAAAIPICGTVNPARLKPAKPVAFRIFHGDADNVVPVEGSRQAYQALKRAGASVEYIEFPGCDHGSWTPAFRTPDFMEWLFKQQK